ncbi:MAG: hypothetical protein OXP73_10395 [Chloroflexota bacterium]|nr:hypothetical protein [Chloroflexota bacterium]
MTIDPTVLPGLALLAAELLALAAVGFVLARVCLGQTDDRMALAQGLAIGPAVWGLLVNFLLHPLPGRTGALACWLLLGLLALFLVRGRHWSLRANWRTCARFAAAALATFGVALAARQTLIVTDAHIRLGLAAPIQAGVWPPVMPWSPWQAIPYHYGTELFVAMLAPPTGPDLAFTAEVLDAYAWTSLALLVGTWALKRGSWVGAFVVTPLLLSAGAWTPLLNTAPALIQVPAIADVPGAGFRASVTGIYWPSMEWPWDWPEPHAAPPNIWLLRFTLAYALALIVFERVTGSARTLAWRSALILGALVGFQGLIEESVALTTLGVWGLLEIVRIAQAQRQGSEALACAWRAAVGPVTAAVLLALGGGVLTGALMGTIESGLTVGWIAESANRRSPVSLDLLPGGLALLGLGPAILAAASVALAWRDRLILALAAGSSVFLIAGALLKPDFAVATDTRLDGHAGNLALLGLMASVSFRLGTLSAHRRLLASALFVALIVWPTVALPLRTLGFQVSHGITLSNAEMQPTKQSSLRYVAGIGRQPIERLAPDQITRCIPEPPPPLHVRPTGALARDRVVDYIRDHTRPDARILSPHPSELTLATGRPNASGFAGRLHIVWRTGPEYLDALRYLEPSAVRRLGVAYVHATDAWISKLPDPAKRRLADPRLFEFLVRDGLHALYRIRPPFFDLDPSPNPRSFEALRRAIPDSATVLLTESVQGIPRVRIATVLTHARLLGHLDTSAVHLLTKLQTEPADAGRPDIVVISREFPLDASLHGWSTVWWNEEAIALITRPGNVPTIEPPPHLEQPDRVFTLRLSDVTAENDHVAFSATPVDMAAAQWTGQDWLVIQMEDASGSWAVPVEDDGYTFVGKLWFPGQIDPDSGRIRRQYIFNALMGTLSAGVVGHPTELLQSAGSHLTQGLWMLAVRLQHSSLQAAVIPVLQVRVSADGEATYTVYEGERRAAVNACPKRLLHTDSCRKLATGN